MTKKKIQVDIPLCELAMEQYILTKWDEKWIEDISLDSEHSANIKYEKNKIAKPMTPILENIDTNLPKKKILKKLVPKQ